MRRFRMLSLFLASSFLFALTGCTSMCENCQLFPRLFDRSAGRMVYEGAECECARPTWAPGMAVPVGQGPFGVPPNGFPPTPTPIPITNVPSAPSPQLFKVPQAPPTAYVPTN